MGCIVCATRGGEGSRAAQLAAIERSKASQRPLIFLYVTDPSTIRDVDESLVSAVQAELDWMGSTLLRIAQRRASHGGIQAQLEIRYGDVREEISQFLSETHAELLLLGAPRGTSANVFGDDAVEQFAFSIQDKTGIPVEVVRPDQ